MRRRWTGRPRRNEFAPVSAELLIAIASTKMTDAARRCLLAIVASSYGRYREHDVPLKRTELEALTSLPHGQISKAIAELERAGILTVQAPRTRGKRATYRIEKRYGDWTPPTVLDPKAETTWRSVPAASDGSHENGQPPEDDDRSPENAQCSHENADGSHENGQPPRVIGGEEEEGLEAATAAPTTDLIAQLERDLDQPWPEPTADEQSASPLPAGGPAVTDLDLPPTSGQRGRKRSRRQLTPGDGLKLTAAQRADLRDQTLTPADLTARWGRLSPDDEQNHDLWQQWAWREQAEWESRWETPPMTEAEMDSIRQQHDNGMDAPINGARP